jgi:hypothetical protein
VTISATIVDWAALLKVVEYSLGITVGFALAFSLSILGATRFVETRRDGRRVVAGAFGALAALTLAASVGAIVFGIVELIASK